MAGSEPLRRFITFEGGEGAGKSTQLARLAEALRATGAAVFTTREPGGTPNAERIRGLLLDPAPGDAWEPLAETLLHFAARREHLRKAILPALNAGAWVLCDRFSDSTRAYQGFGLGVPRELIERLHRLAVEGTEPGLTVVLDLAPAEGLARTRARAGAADRYEGMDLAFHTRLREGFLHIAAAESARCRVIDASLDPDAVAESIRAAIQARYGAIFG